MLEDSIRDYNGSLIVVSHDRYFISKVANKIVEIKEGQLLLYRGGYEYFKSKKLQEKKDAENLIDQAKKEAKRIKNRKLERKRRSKKSNNY